MPKLRDRSEHGQALKEVSSVRAGALLPEEKELCQNVLVYGPAYLRQQKGWSVSAAKEFLERREVMREIELLKRSYEDRTGIQERTQFFAQLRINGLVPSAINTLARALAGARTNADGRTLTPPTKQQFDAAIAILDRANVQGEKFNGNDQTPNIDMRSVNVALGIGDAGEMSTKEGRARIAAALKVITRNVSTEKSVDAIVSRRCKTATNENDDEAEEDEENSDEAE